MSWKIEFRPTAEKYYRKLDKKTRKRVKAALNELQVAEDPTSHSNVQSQTVTLYGDYWLSVDKWRVLFTPDEEKKMIVVFGVIPEDEVL